MSEGSEGRSLSLRVAQEESTAQRLEAMRHTIRDWDWHAPSLDTIPRDDPTEVVLLNPPTDTLFLPSTELADRSLEGSRWTRDRVVATLRRGAWRWAAAGVAALVVVVIIVVAMSSSPPPRHVPPPSNSLAHSEVALQFIGAEGAVDPPTARTTSALTIEHGATSVPVVAGVVTPYVTTLQRFQLELANIRWPASLAQDGAALLTQVSSFASFAQTITSTPSIGLGSWLQAFQAHAASVHFRENVIRRDLGLSQQA
jgi:hypothetical protein